MTPLYIFKVKFNGEIKEVKANHPDEVWGELSPDEPPFEAEILECFENTQDQEK